MKLFVTGGTGFVGSHLLAQALEAGHEVLALRRAGSRPRIDLPQQPRWIDGALDGDHRQVLRDVDVLVHLAAHTANPPYAPLADCLRWNVMAPIALAQQALECGVRRFLVAGSCFEYGQSAERVEVLTPDTPLEPRLSYPTSKAAASLAFLGLAREHALQLSLLRVFQVYGEGEPAGRLWPALRDAALAGQDFPMSPGQQWRDFIDVREAARQFLQALDFTGVQSGQPQVAHVASGQPQRVLDFAMHWWRHWGARGRLRPGAVPYRPGEIMRLVSGCSGGR
ncbi:MAG: NAD-dependent epimerase/dehydratase family protein [Burkholderiaceae bacterium]|jgi:nucleoside-diphosphate-sugar epimerase